MVLGAVKNILLLTMKNIMNKIKIGYKLVKLRKDGTISPLFINKSMVIPINKWLNAESHPTKGYAIRKGWHVMDKPIAPHLSKTGRVWCKIEMIGYKELQRPKSQGGLWWLANKMRVIKIIENKKLDI